MPRQERGSISIWLVTTGFAMIVLVGLAVDLGGQVHAQQHARAVADQAARTGGQQLQAPVAVRGQGLLADTHLRPPSCPHLPDRCRADRNGHHHRRHHGHRGRARHLRHHVPGDHRDHLDDRHRPRPSPHHPIRRRRRAMTSTIRARLIGLTATLAILAVLAGLPAMLLAIGANPIPDHVTQPRADLDVADVPRRRHPDFARPGRGRLGRLGVPDRHHHPGGAVPAAPDPDPAPAGAGAAAVRRPGTGRCRSPAVRRRPCPARPVRGCDPAGGDGACQGHTRRASLGATTGQPPRTPWPPKAAARTAPAAAPGRTPSPRESRCGRSPRPSSGTGRAGPRSPTSTPELPARSGGYSPAPPSPFPPRTLPRTAPLAWPEGAVPATPSGPGTPSARSRKTASGTPTATPESSRPPATPNRATGVTCKTPT